MADAIIENPIINSPYHEPSRHFKFDDEGITNEIIEQRRPSSYFIPIAKPKTKGRQQVLLEEWTQDRIEENSEINRIRARVEQWRKGGYAGITNTSRRLLEYWNDPERENKLFFCQREAVETSVFIAEVARKFGDTWIEGMLRDANDTSNPGLPRIAFKMATGTGKTVVMAMLIAWQALNKFANPQDARFTDAFLIITPGITIKDRLRVLLPNDPNNYYRLRDILPPDLMEQLNRVKIVITNFHTLRPRETSAPSKLGKAILGSSSQNAFTEDPGQMVRRVCRELGNKKNIIVINDEAHHCYRRKPEVEAETLKGDEKKEAEERDRDARVWVNGIEAVKGKMGVKAVYDLSATPFFLKGSGWPEGTLYPWVVSDFSLIDAIESGIVKVPRVPVADDSMQGEQPTYRDLWIRIRDELPKKGRGAGSISGVPQLPKELQGAIHSLYDNYRKAYDCWDQDEEVQARGLTPPVFIVVCNNTNVSKLVYDYISGYERVIADGSIVLVPGALSIFNNVRDKERWLDRPNTVLIDSEQLESGEAMSAEFKKIASTEIKEFKEEYAQRFPGRDAEKLTDEDILREVMNTVGKPGKLGEHIKCVVSVSMLTEGWDATTVTHILGVRAFGTQLLCEQVVGRGLRRMSFTINEDGMFNPEYAEVYGVPFSFIPCSGSATDPKPGPIPTRVRALEERIALEMIFPRLMGYRYEIGSEKLGANFTDDSKMALSTSDIPTKTENAPIVGEKSIHTLDDLKKYRENEVAFLLAKLVLERYFRTFISDEEEKAMEKDASKLKVDDRPWLFPQLLVISKRWLSECVTCKDHAFKQMLLLHEYGSKAAEKIYQSIVTSTEGEHTLKPILYPYDTFGSTRYVDFDTTRPCYATREDKCHISHVVADTESWEQKMAQVLEGMDEVICYVKNHNLGFLIPYIYNGQERNYMPDFLVRFADGRGRDDPLNLIIEVTGQRRAEKEAKVATARNLWVPAVNNHGGLGRWAFLEILDPWYVEGTISSLIKKPE